MTLKGDAKFKEKLTCGLENDMSNMADFHQSTSGADSGLVKLVEMTNFFFNNQHRLLDIKWLISRQLNKAWFFSDS